MGCLIWCTPEEPGMTPLSRRSFLALSTLLPSAMLAQTSNSQTAAAPMNSAPQNQTNGQQQDQKNYQKRDQKKPLPVGLELYSVRDELKRDPQATVRAVAKMGYQGVEFYAPYLAWTEAETKDMRKLLDELGIRCFSTHNDADYLVGDKLSQVRDRNLVLGSSYVVQSSAPKIDKLEGWKTVADNLNAVAAKLEPSGLKAGYHNHQPEFTPLDGKRPIEILAANTKSSIMLQLDVGTCLETGSDPVEWIRANPGRIKSLHLKDWSPDPAQGYKVLFGEGAAEWPDIFTAAETVGGAEYYLMEQEGSRFPELETAQKCLESYRTLRG
jgi:sugar phosphate isomerase/epimerase